MGPHIENCVQRVANGFRLNTQTCDCSFRMEQSARRGRDLSERTRLMVESGPTLSEQQVRDMVSRLDQYRAEKNYAAADQARDLLASFGVRAQTGHRGTTYKVMAGHRVRDYGDWVF